MTLAELQTLAAEALRADPELAGLPVIEESRGDLETQIQKELDRLGLSIVVATTTGSGGDHRHQPLVEAELVVAIVETPLTNSSGHTATAVLDAVIPALHGLPQGAGQGAHRLRYQRHDPVEDLPGVAAYRVVFSGRCSWVARHLPAVPALHSLTHA